MGIQGLIPFLEKASRQINVSDYSGCTVGIDAYCWLHKGVFTCADKLCRGESSYLYIHFCMKLVNMLLSHNIKPILVFDGQRLVAKAETERKRHEARELNRKKGTDLLRLDRVKEAEIYLKRCIDITHEMALNLIRACRSRNVDCIVAPYEADAQLAFLSINNIVQLIITEDSDLLLFGAKNVLFKMDFAGNGLLIEQNKLHIAVGLSEQNFTMDKFRYICMLSGCDYLSNLRGIGLVKASRFIKKISDTDIHRAISRLSAYLNMPQLNVTLEYRDNFIAAEATFLYQPVFDPFSRSIVPLNPLPQDTSKIPEYLLNVPLSEQQAIQLCYGNLNPKNLEKVDSWDPSNRPTPKNASAVATHASIWDNDYTERIKSVEAPSPKQPQPKSPQLIHNHRSPSVLSKNVFQGIFFKKRSESTSGGDKDNSLDQIVSEYRSPQIITDEKNDNHDKSLTDIDTSEKVNLDDSSVIRRPLKRKHTVVDPSRNVVSRYFASSDSDSTLNRLDSLNDLDDLESKLSRIEDSINGEVSFDGDSILLFDDEKSPHFCSATTVSSPEAKNNVLKEHSVNVVKKNNDSSDNLDGDSLTIKDESSDKKEASEPGETLQSPIFKKAKRRNPFLVRSPSKPATSSRNAEAPFNWKDLLRNQFGYLNSDATKVNDSCKSADTVKFQSAENDNVIINDDDKISKDNFDFAAKDKEIADIMTEDEDEGFCSPSTNDVSSAAINAKENKCQISNVRKSTEKSKQTSLLTLFGFKQPNKLKVT